MSRHYRLLLVGFGNVGQAFARLLMKKQQELADNYQVTVSVTGILTGRHGRAIDPSGIDLQQALDLVARKQAITPLDRADEQGDAFDFIRNCPADVMFETTPVNPFEGQPAIDHIKAALEGNMHAITANKGPVVHGYQQLTDLAARHKRRFLFESAVMDGAPIFSLFREPLKGATLKGFFGILNSCTNLLIELMEQGQTLDEAIAYGQSIGIAETDPSMDVDGWDASIKVAALVTVLMGTPLTPQQVNRTGICIITPEMVKQALAEGERWKLVCSARREGERIITKVAPERVKPTSPLYCVNGTSSFCQFELDVLPGLGIMENNPSPETTAFGLLADFLNAAV